MNKSNPIEEKDINLIAGETWRKILNELEAHKIKFPNNFTSIGGAYGSMVIIKEALEAERLRIAREVEIKRNIRLGQAADEYERGYDDGYDDAKQEVLQIIGGKV